MNDIEENLKAFDESKKGEAIERMIVLTVSITSGEGRAVTRSYVLR